MTDSAAIHVEKLKAVRSMTPYGSPECAALDYAIAALAGGQAAVAWQYEASNECAPEAWMTFASTSQPQPHPRVRNVRPLYTHPAPMPDALRELVEKWREADHRMLDRAADELAALIAATKDAP